MDQNFAPYSTPFSLYLKANSDIYSVVRINTLPTIATAISIIAAVLSGLFADKTGRFWIPTVAVTLPVLVGVSMLVAWNVGEKGRLAAFMLTGFEGGLLRSTLLYMTTLTHDLRSGISNDHELGVRRHGERRRGASGRYGQHERYWPGDCCGHTSCAVACYQCSEFPDWVSKCAWNYGGAAFDGCCYFVL